MWSHTGELLSVGSAGVWALSIVLYQRAQSLSGFELNLCKNSLAFVLTALTLLALGEPIATGRSAEDWARLLGSGMLGLGLADALFLHALQRLGPGVAAIVECAYAPGVVAASLVLNGEQLATGFYLGAPLVVLGVGLASWSPRRTGAAPARGAVLLGVGAVTMMALGIVLAKPALERSDVIESAFVRMWGALAFQLVWGLSSRRRWSSLRVLGPGPHWRQLFPSAFLGAYVGMMLWIGGMKLTEASVSAVLNQTSTIFTLLFARVVVGEKFTAPRVFGALLAAGGAAVIVTRVSLG